MPRLLIFLGIAVAIISVALCAYRSGARYTRYTRYTGYTRYTRYTTYTTYRSSGGGVIAGYVIGAIVGSVLIGLAIYFCMKHYNKKKQSVTPRNTGQKPPINAVSGRMVQPPPYPGPGPGYNSNYNTSYNPAFNPAYNPAPQQPGMGPAFYPPPTYSEAAGGQAPPAPPPVMAPTT